MKSSISKMLCLALVAFLAGHPLSTTGQERIAELPVPSPAPEVVGAAKSPGLLEFTSVLESDVRSRVVGSLNVKVTPIEFQVAEAAMTVELPDGRVMIFTEGLVSGVSYGQSIYVEDIPVSWIEAFLVGGRERRTLKEQPNNPGVFILDGKSGDVYDLRISNYPDPPTWVYDVKIPGPTVPEPDPIPDGEIATLSKARADALNDPETRAALKVALVGICDELDAMCESDDCPKQEDAELLVESSLAAVLAARTGDSRFVEWKKGWRLPVGEAILAAGLSSVPRYVLLLRDAAAGL